jgi:hypothetical protein
MFSTSRDSGLESMKFTCGGIQGFILPSLLLLPTQFPLGKSCGDKRLMLETKHWITSYHISQGPVEFVWK